MKANEAPEKLYVNFHFIETHPESHQPLVTKQGINKYDIEYTRTDVFIEKAVRRLEHYIDNGAWIASDVGHREKEAIIEDFRKYLEE